MRPLLVITLVACAVAALLYALTSLGGEEGLEDPVLVPTSSTPEVDDRPTEDLTLPSGMATPLEETTPERREVATGFDTQLATDGYIEGVIVNVEEEAVAGALVQLIRQKGGGQLQVMRALMGNKPLPKPLKQVYSDEAGQFRFDRVPVGRNWSLVVTHDEYSRKSVNGVEVKKTGGRSERVVLDRGFAIFGTVSAKRTGLPIEGALLVLDNPAAAYMSSAQNSPDRLTAVSGPNGEYRIDNIPGESRALTITKEGFATQIDQRSVSQFDQEVREKNLDIFLLPGMPIAGRVVGPNDEGIAGVQIDAIGSGSPSSRGTAVSKAGGEFVIPDLCKGRYTLRVEADGFDRAPLQADAGDTNVLIELTARGGIAGRVVDPSGSPLQNFRLTIRQAHPTNIVFGHPQGDPRNIRGARDGQFKVDGLPPASYVVQADAQGYASSFSDAVTVEEGAVTQDVVVRMSSGGTIVGEIIDKDTKEPLAGVRVSTQSDKWIESDFTAFIDSISPTAITRAQAVTNAAGKFEIELITPEVYQLRLSRDGYNTEVIDGLGVVADEVNDLGVIQMTKGATVRGVAYLANGQPAPNARVTLKSLDEKEIYHTFQVRSDAEGRFLIGSVPAGDYALACATTPKPGESPLLTVVDMDRSRVEIYVREGADVVQDLYLGDR